ncbi:hypothetical protein AOLI_G00108240 [Acnodon oligacanthus]
MTCGVYYLGDVIKIFITCCLDVVSTAQRHPENACSNGMAQGARVGAVLSPAVGGAGRSSTLCSARVCGGVGDWVTSCRPGAHAVDLSGFSTELCQSECQCLCASVSASLRY